MQSSQQPEDDGLVLTRRLKRDQIDVILGSHPGKRAVVRKKSSGSLLTIVIFLMLVGACTYLVAQLFHTGRAVAQPAAKAPEVSQPVVEMPAVAAPVDPIRTSEQVVYVAPKVETVPPTTKPLDHCLKDGNVIDQEVINCRFGEGQRPPSTVSRPQGMVSDRYLAEYKSGSDRAKAEQRDRPYKVAGVFIRGINDRNRYEARYRIYDNHIQTSSVCFNFSTDSVEYRECRRAAVPFFKDSCSDWTKRVAKDRSEQNRMAQEQYCEAASSYQP